MKLLMKLLGLVGVGLTKLINKHKCI